MIFKILVIGIAVSVSVTVGLFLGVLLTYWV